MTVGIVVVSHSAALAAGVVELAGQMAPEVTIVAAGGTDDGALGTSFDLVTGALDDADSGDGVVVLYDLGSALLTTDTALELLDPQDAERVVVADAPLVEGAVAAAVAAQSGASRDAVAGAASDAGQQWGTGAEMSTTAEKQAGTGGDAHLDPAVDAASTATATATVADAIGIHARPASLLVRQLDRWPDTSVTVNRSGETPVDMRSVLLLISLGLRQGEQIELRATGPDAAEAVGRLAEMVDAGLDPA